MSRPDSRARRVPTVLPLAAAFLATGFLASGCGPAGPADGGESGASAPTPPWDWSEAEVRGEDEQLRAAVEDLLKRL